MPKAEKGTPKDIANRAKAKGLQKLKFYCQMCEKQCRDENGFKCHMTSDSHLRQMKIFRENAGGMMDSFSKEFELGYVETLRRRHGTQRMNANNVYQEVIQDKYHVHMNSTKWASLSDFVQYLGKKGVCVVEETERGWYVSYIERDPTLLSRQEKLKKKTEADRREERREASRRDNLRMEAAKALDRAGCSVERKASEIGERDEGAKMEMKLGASLGNPAKGKKKNKSKSKISLLEEDDDDEDEAAENEKSPMLSNGDRVQTQLNNSNGKQHQTEKGRPEQHIKQPVKRSLERSIEKKEVKKQKSNDENDHRSDNQRKDHWLHRDIIVRIISKKLAKGAYYKRKAIVDKVIDKYEAELEVLETSRKARDGGDVLRIDQDDLETVVPKESGEKVRILNGKYRGKKARVVKLDKDKYRAELRLSGEDDIVVLDYEDFSKMA